MNNKKLLKEAMVMIKNHIDKINSGDLGISEVENALKTISELSKLVAENYWIKI